MAEVSAVIKDAQSGAYIPIDCVPVATAPPAPSAGQAIRQVNVLGKSDGSTTYADPDGNGNLKVNVTTGTIAVVQGSVAALTTVAASTTSVSLLASNALRVNMYVVNSSSIGNLFMAFAATASLSSYTIQIPPGGLYEFSNTAYTGAISGIWDNATAGAALITEVST